MKKITVNKNNFHILYPIIASYCHLSKDVSSSRAKKDYYLNGSEVQLKLNTALEFIKIASNIQEIYSNDDIWQSNILSYVYTKEIFNFDVISYNQNIYLEILKNDSQFCVTMDICLEYEYLNELEKELHNLQFQKQVNKIANV